MSWLEWLRHLAPLRPPDNRVRSVWEQTVLVPLAEALELAAPQGPRGMPDETVARGTTRILVDVLQEEISRWPLSTAAGERSGRTVEELMRELLPAVALDVAGQPPPSLHELRQLARLGTHINPENAGVAVARARYPKTWEVLKSWTH